MKTVSTLALLVGAALIAPTAPAEARLRAEPVVGPVEVDEAGPTLARRGRGADDPAGHDAGDDRGRRGKNGGKGRGRGADDGPGHGWQDGDGTIELARQGRGRGRGSDDPPGDDRRGRGRGADDPPGHDAGDDHGRRGRDGGRGRGRGWDDPPGHTFLFPEEAIALVLPAPASHAARS